MTWTLNTAVTSMSGEVTETLDSNEREALVNVTALPDGRCVVSLSLLLDLGWDSRASAEGMLECEEWRAMPKAAMR